MGVPARAFTKAIPKPLQRQHTAQLLSGYGAIHLKREGDYAVVEVQAPNGDWVEVIREALDSQFGHIVEPTGILAVLRGHGI